MDSRILHTMLVRLTGRWLPTTCLFPFLWMAVILAFFHADGSLPVLTEVWYIRVSGLINADLVSYKIRGCIWSGPGDLVTLILANFLPTVSSSMDRFSLKLISGLLAMSHIPSTSFVNTLEKKEPNFSAFSWSFSVISFGDSSSLVYRSGILDFTLVLLAAYFQNLLGLFLTSFALYNKVAGGALVNGCRQNFHWFGFFDIHCKLSDQKITKECTDPGCTGYHNISVTHFELEFWFWLTHWNLVMHICVSELGSITIAVGNGPICTIRNKLLWNLNPNSSMCCPEKLENAHWSWHENVAVLLLGFAIN